jgi:hypothetical protein
MNYFSKCKIIKDIIKDYNVALDFENKILVFGMGI